jgi:putative radical SAM enzyme (TIGR03279 family)
MQIRSGVIIDSVRSGSPASRSGLQPGDTIISINGRRIGDLIDYLFFADGERLDMIISRKGRKIPIVLEKEDGNDSGIELRHFKIKTCRNKCIFCFVNQLPKGLRRSLYIKDEDYRMSFLYGNYITLSNITPSEKKRIVEQRLSPLYISVHSTRKELRNRLLGNPKATDILKDIRFFKEHKIKMHCQIVLCPDYNDGEELQKTINDLYKFYPYVASIAVVPVGLTSHRKNVEILRPVEERDAQMALEIIEQNQRRFKKRHGDNIVYGADELYIRAGKEFPPLREYGDLPQIENGVGMVPQFLSQARSILSKKNLPRIENKERLNFITFTGLSFYPYLRRFIDKLNEKANLNISALPVENQFFGRSVTVTGLLTGRDVIKTLYSSIDGKERKELEKTILLIPDTVLKSGDSVFLDDISVKEIQDALGIKTIVINATPVGLIKGMEAQYEN